MGGIIQLLPEGTANQIAAGEVVQRPASVVKELLENAIDAGATQISLYIKNGGCTSIRVDDNGSGMNAFDARMCWERHATSKITQASDLYNLHTLGFRGEALASIASVSDVEMKTKLEEESVGTRLVIEAGKVVVQENTAAKTGTSITVKNLFYNIPARKNFLKSISVETKHIYDELQRIALSYPNVGLEFYNQDKQVISLSQGKLKSRICELLRVSEDALIPTNEQTDIVGISGFIGSPKLAKKTRGNQFLFANGRFIKDNYLNHAISTAYGNLLEEKSFPLFVLFLDVEPSKIDVNIHPTKHEVKFEDGRHMYTLLNSVIKKSLGEALIVPTETQLDNVSQTPHYNPRFETSTPNKRFNPFGETKTKTPSHWEKLDELLQTPIPETQPTPSQVPLIEPQEIPDFENCFQLHQKYIICKIKGELCLINQHRAHSQVLFEHYAQNSAIASQQLLFPRTLEVSPQNFQLYVDLREDLQNMGFDTNEFGKNTIIINGLPSEISKTEGSEILLQVLEDYTANFQELKLDKTTAIRMAGAKNAAIKTGTGLSEKEQNKLVSDLLHCKQSSITEDGKPIIVKLKQESVERFFQ